MEEEARAAGVPLLHLGATLPQPSLRVREGTEVLLEEQLSALRDLWEKGLLEAMQNR
jgi:hypothetical protein